MRNLWFVCLLIGTMAWAQAKLATPSSTPNHPAAADEQDQDDGTQKPPSAAGVAADAPVLTVRGLCAQSTPTPGAERARSACQTVVTRAQFESLVDALRAGKDAPTMRRLAQAYPQFLVMAHAAELQGLDKQPRFKQRMDFARLQILSQELMAEFQEEAAQVPESDIENYYQKNTSEFESVSVERIVIPNRAQGAPQSTQQAAEQNKASEDVMTKEAERLRVRAAAGEDFSKLQKQAYDAAGISGNNAPNPKMDKMRRRGLPPAHASVFGLQPGQVSQVISDPTGHYIYKLDSKGIEPLDSVRHEISNALRGERLQKMIQSLQQPFTTDVNQAYFGADVSGQSD